MLYVIGVLILFGWALALSYKIGRVDGISYTVDWLAKEGLLDPEGKRIKKSTPK